MSRTCLAFFGPWKKWRNYEKRTKVRLFFCPTELKICLLVKKKPIYFSLSIFRNFSKPVPDIIIMTKNYYNYRFNQTTMYLSELTV